MKVTGIIAEYNPLHNGHRYHIDESRKLTGADYVIVLLSGDYVQRGEPALLDKHLRAQMALAAGADLVLELPFPFCSMSAEDFASCAVSMFNYLGVVDYLAFGSECGDLEALYHTASILCREPESYRLALKSALSQGLSFPAAREYALSCYLNASEPWRNGLSVLSSPNNLLGIEYCKALIYTESSIHPVTIARKGSGYHDSSVCSDSFPSATAIRQILKNQQDSKLPGLVPEEILPLFHKGEYLFPDDFSSLLDYAVLSSLPDGYEGIYGFSRELSDRLTGAALSPCSWEERILQLKTRNYTYTRISRALLSLLLRLTEEEVQFFRDAMKEYPVIRILGFQRSAQPLLSAIKASCPVPLLSKLADAFKNLPPASLQILEKGILASHIYASVQSRKYNHSPVHEYCRQLTIR